MVVGGDLGMHSTLSRIVVTARALVSARFASVRMLDSAGGEIGVASDGTRPRPGEPTAAPISLAIRAREEYHGALELVGTSTGAEFITADRNLLTAFAAAAGTAIGNAHRYDDARRRQAWLRASSEATATLLGAAPAVALAAVVRSARMVANADIAWIEVADSPVLVVDPPTPAMTDLFVNERAAAGLLHEVAETGQSVLVGDATRELGHAVAEVAVRAGIGPLLAVPLRTGDGLLGVLILANKQQRRGFSRLDTEMATTFAGQAAVALEFARAQSVRDRLHLVEERGRIARDLHDVVIQRLFAVGLRLEAMCRRVPDDEANQLANTIEELNHTINDIRNAIFSLRTGEQTRTKLTDRLEQLFERAEQTLGFAPTVQLDEALDETVPGRIHLHLLATLNEALSNVARHASATTVTVQVSSSNGILTATVVDDGVGLAPIRTESGLANLRRRAEIAEGTMRTEPGADGRGLMLIWQVPLAGGPSTD
jgi:signal transduction histidine kinase